VIPIELELQNFLAYRDPGKLNFEGIRIACLAGPNGAGKSSLLDAITWAVWGKARSNSPDELIHQGQNDMRVSLTFEHGGDRFRVMRQRKSGKRGTSLLELQGWDRATESWRGLSEATMRATQAKIDELLRLDYETFVNSAFLMQGRADEFTTKTPNQRKQVLSTILGLERWERYEDQAKTAIADVRAEIQRVEGRLDEIDRELGQREDYRRILKEAEENAKVATQKLQEAEQQWTELEKTRADMASLQRQMDDLRHHLPKIKTEITETKGELEAAQQRADKVAITVALEEVRSGLSRLETFQSQHEDLTQQIAKLSNEAAHLKGVNAALVPETEPLKERIVTLDTSTEPICPTCGQPLTEKHKARLVEELKQEVEERREQFRANRARIESLEASTSALNKELKNLNEQLALRSDLVKKGGQLESALKHADEAATQVKALEGKLSRWLKELESASIQEEELEKQLSQKKRLLEAGALTNNDLDRIRYEKRLADERVGGARQQLSALDALEEMRSRQLEKQKALAADLGLYEDLRIAFSKKGVPAMIIETAVPELERSANELLSRMTDGRMAVRIETQREIKTGELREALDIIISDELGTRPYDLYSGGESFRINFAIRIALSRLLARRAGAQLRSLYIDEGFGSQDAHGRDLLVSAINSIQDDFDLILVITHIEEMKEAFPARIEVTKTPDGSQFQLT
jgi:exonuclease SbcC